jgi:hypothetical protein
MTEHYNHRLKEVMGFSSHHRFLQRKRMRARALHIRERLLEKALWKATIVLMARGWESKSVEAQQDEAADKSLSGKPRLTPEEANRIRERESLRLSLRNIVDQLERSRNSQHREMLEHAKTDLERRLEGL